MATLSTRTKLNLDILWDKLARLAGYPNGFDFKFSELLAGDANATSEAMNLFVDGALGDDSFPGTQAQPFKTIPAALDAVPRTIKHPVLITVAPGNYAGFTVSGFVIEPRDDGAYLVVQGTLSTASLASGVTGGTVTSATAGATSIVTGWSTVTVTGAGWTVSNLRAKYLRIVSGTGAGQVKCIYDNTADVITVTGTWTTTPDATSVFDIVVPGTVINSNVTVPAEPLGNGLLQAASTPAAVVFSSGRHASRTSTALNRARMAVQWLKFTGISTGIIVAQCDRVGIYGCDIDSTTTGIQLIGTGADASVVECVSTRAAISFLSNSTGGHLHVINCVTSGSNTIITSNANSQQLIQTSAFVGITQGFYNWAGETVFSAINIIATGVVGTAIAFRKNNSFISGFGKMTVANCSFSTFLKVCELHGHGTFLAGGLSGHLLGTGNTTVFELTKGPRVLLTSGSTITGTNEIVIEGAAAVTIASMRAASPKVLPAAANPYGTCIYE